MSHRNDNLLVFKRLDLAIANLMLKGDIGTFKAKLDAQGIKANISRVERYIDNGPIDGFWRNLEK